MVNAANFSNTYQPTSRTLTSGLKQQLMLTDDARDILLWFLFTFICQVIDIFGASTNIINIICFIKQGFKDPVNVSLLGMSTVYWLCTRLCNANYQLTSVHAKKKISKQKHISRMVHVVIFCNILYLYIIHLLIFVKCLF